MEHPAAFLDGIRYGVLAAWVAVTAVGLWVW
jgi:hypothetical protein